MAVTIHPEMLSIIEQWECSELARMLTLRPEEVQAMVASLESPPWHIEMAEIRDLVIPSTEREIPARLYHPDPGTDVPLVVWFHGGGWVLGTLDLADSVATFLAHEANVAVLSVDYRLAPQHPFPAAADDCLAAAAWAMTHPDQLGIDASRVAIGGDSAGGNLAAVVTQDLHRNGNTPPVAAQFLVYPITDHDPDRPSMIEFAEGYILSRDIMNWFHEQYAPNPADREAVRYSPIKAEDLSGLPPAVVLLAEADVLHDEGLAYGQRLQDAGVPTEMHVATGMIHGFIGNWMISPNAETEFRTAIQHLSRFLHSD